MLIRENLDHIEIGELITETMELRKKPEEKNNESLESSWNEFKKSNSLNNQIVANGEVTTLSNLLSF